MTRPPLHLNLFLSRSGHHSEAWRLPDADPKAILSLKHYARVAQLAEAARFDSLFLSDVLFLSEGRGPMSGTEPLTTLSALAAVTERIGLIGTASTSYCAPFHIARQFASLDHLSGGRAGWNIVTSRHDEEARNFGVTEHAGHDDRYRRADEFIEVVKGLWDGWDEDAIVAEREGGPWLDRSRIRPLNHVGGFFSVAGPLNLPRSPQGRPVLFQAGASAQGRDLALRHADAIFTVQPDFASARDFYRDIKQRARHFGRAPEDVLVLPGAYTLVGDSQTEVRALEEQLAAHVDVAAQLRSLSSLIGVDLTGEDPDTPLRELGDAAAVRTSRSFHAVFSGLAQQPGVRLRDLLGRLAAGSGHFQAIGTPDQIADQFEAWYLGGAADGFNLKPATIPDNFELFTAEVIPRLQRRGLFRTEYQAGTLSENLGLRQRRRAEAVA